MSQHDGEYDDLVGRALHAAADLAEPAGDGLDRIRARLETPYPRPVAWLLTASAEATGHALSGLLSVSAWLQAVLAAASERRRMALGARFAPAPRSAAAGGYEHDVITPLEELPGWSFRTPDGEVLDGAAPLRLPGLLRRSPSADRDSRTGPRLGARWLAPVACAVLVAAVAATPAALSHVLHGGREPAWPQQAGTAADATAAAWVAAQVSPSAGVACDPVMCLALQAHRFAGRLLPLGLTPAFPRGARVMVVTPAVRGEYGRRVSSAYAPVVLASFGSGRAQIQVRVTAPHGAAALGAVLRADLINRTAAARAMLPSYQIEISGTARRQFLAGLADSRLILAITDVAGKHEVSIVAFGDSGPGAGPGIPLRSVELAQPGPVTRTAAAAAYFRAVKAMLLPLPAPYRPAHMETVRGPGGRLLLRVEFAAPEPPGLVNPGAGETP